jgi:uncharacterized membrane protein
VNQVLRGKACSPRIKQEGGKKIMWGLIVMQWLHVFLGIFWFGSTLYVDFVVIPAVMTLPLAQHTTFLWGHFVVGRSVRQLEAFPLSEVTKSGGTVAVAFAVQVQRVKLLALLQLCGFFVIFTGMILMRFGL